MVATRRDPRLTAIAVLAVLVIAGGLALGFFGVGSQLAEEKTVRLGVLVTEIPEEVAREVQVGDQVFTDPGGMIVGEVVEVEAGPWLVTVPDAEGQLHGRQDPTMWQVKAVIEATGRQSEDIVAIDNEVVQAGQYYSLISRDYYIKGIVVSVDVL
ncbi:MAG: DUF4330 domain-containing protein [Coriobacteriia bacterium]|nr:DUF4330 domain-containing protein [Coriobacteriia bacterium]